MQERPWTFFKMDPNEEGLITNGCEEWFTITAIYETTTHTDSYRQNEFHKLASIKFFNKTPYDATIIIFFNKFIAALRDLWVHRSYTRSARQTQVPYSNQFPDQPCIQPTLVHQYLWDIG